MSSIIIRYYWIALAVANNFDKQLVSSIPDKAILLIIAPAPSFSVDCAVYSRQLGDQLLQSWQEGEQFYYPLQKNVINSSANN